MSPSGPWQRVLPGVVLMSTGPPTRRQRLRAAVAYVGRGAVISGADALREQGIRSGRRGCADVGVGDRRLSGRSYLTVERTTRPPAPVWLAGLPLAPVPRATIDAARHERDRLRLRTLILAPIALGACTLADLRAELAAGNQRGSAALGSSWPASMITNIRRAAWPRCPKRRYGHSPGTTRPSPRGRLDHPRERVQRLRVGAGSTAPGAAHLRLIGHEQTLRRTSQ